MAETINHASVAPTCSKPIRLHFTLDDVEWIAADPQRLARHSAAHRDLDAAHLVARDLRPTCLLVGQELEREEPAAVRLDLAPQRHRLPAEQAAQGAGAVHRAHASDAVKGPVVEAPGAVGLCLEPDTDVFDRAGEDRVGDTGEGAGEVVLGVG